MSGENVSSPVETVKRTRPVVAIDGPAGAGKSTLAAHLARRFGFLNLETGAMYRALALKAIQSDIDFDDEPALLQLVDETQIRLEPEPGGNRVLLDCFDVSRRIREPDVTAAASRVSVHPHIRTWMVEHQRALGAAGGIVMEGRDIGTVVFPDAEVKIFLDAAPEVRGNRRFRQSAPGGPAVVSTPPPPTAEEQKVRQAVIEEMRERDRRDRTRAESPLRAADDAVVIDSTGMTLDQVLARAEEIVRSHLPR
jgi:cytidylate kinase